MVGSTARKRCNGYFLLEWRGDERFIACLRLFDLVDPEQTSSDISLILLFRLEKNICSEYTFCLQVGSRVLAIILRRRSKGAETITQTVHLDHTDHHNACIASRA